MNKALYCARRVALAQLYLGAISIPSAVLAQGAPAEEAGGLEEVVVTAQFRAERQNHGYRWGPTEVMAALSRHESVDPSAYYMRTAPRFDVPEGRYAWMSRHVFVGVAEKTPQGNSINCFMLI